MAELERIILEIRARPELRKMLAEADLATIPTSNGSGIVFWTALSITKKGLGTRRWYGPQIESDNEERAPISMADALAKFDEAEIRSDLQKALKQHKEKLDAEKRELDGKVTENAKKRKEVDEVSVFLD